MYIKNIFRIVIRVFEILMDRDTDKSIYTNQNSNLHMPYNIPNLLLICIDITLVPVSRAAKSGFRPTHQQGQTS